MIRITVVTCLLALAFLGFGCAQDQGSQLDRPQGSHDFAANPDGASPPSAGPVPGGYYTFFWDVFAYSTFARVDTRTGNAAVLGYTHLYYNHGGDIMPTKVKVCHVAQRGHKYVPIEIALEDLADHRAHGDLVPGVDFPGCDCPADGTGRPGDDGLADQ